MIIGKFNITGTGYTGVIQTLTFKTQAVFEPVEKKTDKSPDFRITNGETDIGAAWKETSEKTGNSYLSVRLDAPTLSAPISCALIKVGAEQGHTLVWERSRRH
jgi:uncharacterized protein (DUF736 family)